MKSFAINYFLLSTFVMVQLMGMQDQFTYRNITLEENKRGALILHASRSDDAFICILKSLKDEKFQGYYKPTPLSGYEKLPQEETQRLYAELVELFKRKQLLAKY